MLEESFIQIDVNTVQTLVNKQLNDISNRNVVVEVIFIDKIRRRRDRWRKIFPWLKKVETKEDAGRIAKWVDYPHFYGVNEEKTALRLLRLCSDSLNGVIYISGSDLESIYRNFETVK